MNVATLAQKKTLTVPFDEKELLALLRHKNESAFSQLYDHYAGALYGLLLRMLRHKELADDVLPQVFVAIWSQIEEYDAEKFRLFTWMQNIARHKAIPYIGHNLELLTQDSKQVARTW